MLFNHRLFHYRFYCRLDSLILSASLLLYAVILSGLLPETAPVLAAAPNRKGSVPERGAESAPETAGGPMPARYRDQILELAASCEAASMPLEAEITRRLLWDAPPAAFIFPVLSNQKRSPLPGDATEAQTGWFARLTAIETEAANELFQEARTLAEEGNGYAAWKKAAAALLINPDYSEIRALFGQKEIDGFWRSRQEAENIDSGLIDHPVFGWIPAEEITSCENESGGTSSGGTESSEAQKRAKKGARLVIESEHFRIESALSRQETVRISRLLETFHQFWYFHFYPMMMTEKEAAGFVLGKPIPKEKTHKIRIFRNRDDYLQAATKIDASAVVSSGGYLPSVESIYAYEPENPEDTPLETMLIHEAVHQLFAESPAVRKVSKRRKVLNAGLVSNYWILEGIAVYFETFRVQSGRVFVGGTVSPRFLRAKERADEPNGLLGLEMFTGLGKERFQSAPNLPALYTESAGLTHFLLHAGGRRYSEAFHQLLFMVYRNEETPDSLEDLTGMTFEELDEEFRDYLRRTPFTE